MTEEIRNTIFKLKSTEIAAQYLERLYEERKNLLDRCDVLNGILENKFQDIETLTSNTLKSIYLRLLKNRDAVLEIEKQRYLEISIEFKEVNKSVEQVNYEIGILEPKISAIEVLKAELKDHISNYIPKAKNSTLTKFRSIIQKSQSNLEIIKEIEEAIEQGVIVNNHSNKILKYLKKEAQEVYNEFRDKTKIKEFQVFRIDRYQDLIIALRHYLIKYDVEVADVYEIILDDATYNSPKLTTAIVEYRENLVSDLFNSKTLGKSFQLVQRIKSHAMSITKSLRSDLRKLKKKQIVLDKEESEMMLYLKTYAV